MLESTLIILILKYILEYAFFSNISHATVYIYVPAMAMVL